LIEIADFLDEKLICHKQMISTDLIFISQILSRREHVIQLVGFCNVENEKMLLMNINWIR